MRLWQHIRTLRARPASAPPLPAPHAVGAPPQQTRHAPDLGGETIRTFWNEVTGDECCYGQALRLAKTTRSLR